ncbi:sporulation protein [Paenibacillus athensensis]|uniref:Nucleoside transporter/FeoB GTPase Gate domain-containing protein n=1 Tax=Paenibacillus athensensis TaxID=1967502 RepID=A0A4Y8PX26_9BACL|nr:nucleoside recognition domain-containing protein [Paenibacillus athensensis]MCD1257872.1 sporulation protein [Paenibacillus athensensis]
MQRSASRPGRSFAATLLLGALAAAVVASVVAFPDRAFQASLQGLTVWWKLVFPALLPFLILSELLVGFGVIHALGTLMTPLMRRVFGLSGFAGWALASGLVIGFPAGAKITADLREKQLITRREAERLAALSHVCSPIFLVGVVGAGFLHSARLGLALAVVHYAAALLTGVLLRVRRPGATRQGAANDAGSAMADGGLLAPPSRAADDADGASLIRQALRAMRAAYVRDGRAFGKLLGDAVVSSVQTLMLVGGYMMIFAVLAHVAASVRLTAAVGLLGRSLAGLLGAAEAVDASAWVQSALDVHLGSYALSQAGGLPPAALLALIGAALGWGGLSAHAQVAGLLHRTDVRYAPFLLARCVHAGLAFALTLLLARPLAPLWSGATPSLAPLGAAGRTGAGLTADAALAAAQAAAAYGWPLALALVTGALLLASLALHGLRRRSRGPRAE